MSRNLPIGLCKAFKSCLNILQADFFDDFPNLSLLLQKSLVLLNLLCFCRIPLYAHRARPLVYTLPDKALVLWVCRKVKMRFLRVLAVGFYLEAVALAEAFLEVAV